MVSTLDNWRLQLSLQAKVPLHCCFSISLLGNYTSTLSLSLSRTLCWRKEERSSLVTIIAIICSCGRDSIFVAIMVVGGWKSIEKHWDQHFTFLLHLQLFFVSTNAPTISSSVVPLHLHWLDVVVVLSAALKMSMVMMVRDVFEEMCGTPKSSHTLWKQ